MSFGNIFLNFEIFTIFMKIFFSESMNILVQDIKALILLHLLSLGVHGQDQDMEKKATLHVTGNHDLGM